LLVIKTWFQWFHRSTPDLSENLGQTPENPWLIIMFPHFSMFFPLKSAIFIGGVPHEPLRRRVRRLLRRAGFQISEVDLIHGEGILLGKPSENYGKTIETMGI